MTTCPGAIRRPIEALSEAVPRLTEIVEALISRNEHPAHDEHG